MARGGRPDGCEDSLEEGRLPRKLRETNQFRGFSFSRYNGLTAVSKKFSSVSSTLPPGSAV